MIKVATKLRPFRFVQRYFPLWSLRWQSRIVRRSFELELGSAKSREERSFIEMNQRFELNAYDEAIQMIHTQRLTAKARELFISIPDLKWTHGEYGQRFLDEESLSRLHHAVKLDRDRDREIRIKYVAAITGVIGALIGLISIWKK